MFIISIIIAIILLIIISITINYLKNTKEKLNDNTYNMLLTITITLLCTFIGAFLAIQITIIQKNIEEEENYVSLLKTSRKINEYYINAVKIVIDNVDSKPVSYFDMYNSITNIKEHFILMEIVKNGYLDKYSSKYFKNYITLVISLIQKNDLKVLKNNINSFETLYSYLIFKQELLDIEIDFREKDINENQMAIRYRNALENLNGVIKNILGKNYLIVTIVSDSINVYNKRINRK